MFPGDARNIPGDVGRFQADGRILNWGQWKPCWLALIPSIVETSPYISSTNLVQGESIMPKSDFIPSSDHEFAVWLDHFISSLLAKPAFYGLTEDDLTPVKTASADFHGKLAAAIDAAAIAKQANADKDASHHTAETEARLLTRRVKALPSYTPGMGALLGIEGPKNTFDLATAKPDLSGVDQTGGVVVLSFTKHKSDGVNIYCQREGDADWVLIGRATVSPFVDKRPLLQTGKPELRRYTAVYMQKDKEIGQFSDDLVINCAP